METEIVFFDEAGEKTPLRGEMGIKSEFVALEYWRQEELSRCKFLKTEGKERIYLTGDLGVRRIDGRLDFLGRKDNQVKIRGFRVELGEIEQAIRANQKVRESVAAIRKTGSDNEVVAYFVPKEEGGLEPDELLGYLRRRLPDYMVPYAVVPLKRLPLTPNGKIDLQALPEPERRRSGGAYIGPKTIVEEILVDIWREVLKLETLGTHDNFFELGGHSLMATQLMSRVREVLQVELPLRALFEMPTVAGLGERVEAQQSSGGGLVVPAIRPTKREGPFPLSYAQERLWFIDQLQPGSTAYNMLRAIRLLGGLRIGALERAVNEIVRRHEALRTRFEVAGDKPVQVMGEYEWQALPVVDLMGVPEPEREAAARRLVQEESGRAFDLSRGPLMRAQVLRVGPENHIILCTLHHIISDGWSMGVLNRELEVLYEAFAKGQSSPLEELPVQYGDFAVWQRQWLQGEVWDRQMKYWQGQLAGLSPLQLRPTTHVR